jgi:hypothetical protein
MVGDGNELLTGIIFEDETAFMTITGASVAGKTGNFCRFDHVAQPDRQMKITIPHMKRLAIHPIARSS